MAGLSFESSETKGLVSIVIPTFTKDRFIGDTLDSISGQSHSKWEVIVVEGLFDYAVLWQAGFHNVTCSMGTHLNRHQLRRLSDCDRAVYLTFDADSNGSGQQAAQSLAAQLREQGVNARTVLLPQGHDPNSWFVQSGDAQPFQSMLDKARP